MDKEEHKRRCSPKGCAIFLTLVVLVFNCLFLTLMISKSIVINQENQILLGKLLALSSVKNYNDDIIKYKVDMDEKTPPPPEMLVQFKSSEVFCTPCPTTPTPDPIDGHLNPVGILNEVSETKARYTCIHSCEHPVTHISYLTIEDPCCAGITWTGVGRSKAMSKQAAAYKALQEKFPEDAASVAPQNIPPIYNPQHCQVPHEGGLLLLATGNKC